MMHAALDKLLQKFTHISRNIVTAKYFANTIESCKLSVLILKDEIATLLQ